MNFLQVWHSENNKKPPKKLLACMDSVLSVLKSEDTYTLISDKNYLPPSITFISYQEYITVMRYNETIRKFLDILNQLEYKTKQCTISDAIRFHYASNNKNVLYCDCDVELKKPLELDPSKFYMAVNSNHRTTIDSFIMYNSTNTELPRLILDQAISQFFRSYERNKEIGSLETKAWCWQIFNSYQIRKQINKINSDKYEHLENTKYER